MVGDNVEQQTQAKFLKAANEVVEIENISEVDIEPIKAADVIAVSALWRGLEKGRSIAIRDAEVPQVLRQCRCLLKSELLVELQTVSGAGKMSGSLGG